jgi:hypothetical protein
MSNRISVWSHHESDRHHEKPADGGRLLVDHVPEVGSDPWLGRSAGALVRLREAGDASALCHAPAVAATSSV